MFEQYVLTLRESDPSTSDLCVVFVQCVLTLRESDPSTSDLCVVFVQCVLTLRESDPSASDLCVVFVQCVLTLRESDPSASDAIASTFCYCCWNNQSFSACTIEDLQLQISEVPSNETRNYFKVLADILVSSCEMRRRKGRGYKLEHGIQSWLLTITDTVDPQHLRTEGCSDI